MYIYQVERDLLRQGVAKHAHVLKGKVLDVGCGRLMRYRDLLSGATEYVRLDVDPESHPDVVASAEEIPLQDASVDGILCNQVLGDVVHPERAIADCFRVLKPGGHMILTEALMNESHDEPHDFWRFTRFGLNELFCSVGFEVVVIERLGGFFSVIVQFWSRWFIQTFALYKHAWVGRACSVLFFVCGKTALWLDKRLEHSSTGQKFTLDHIIVAKKPHVHER